MLIQLSRCYGSRSPSVKPLYTAVDRFEESRVPVCQLAQCQAVTHRIQLSVFSELLVKLEISLTLSGEIDNSNVKEVEEVSA